MTSLRSVVGRPRVLLPGLVVVALVAAIAVFVGLRGGERTAPRAADTSGPAATSPTPTATSTAAVTTTVATARTDLVTVYDTADAAAARQTLDRREELSRQLVFVVVDRTGDRLQVQLPVRPNGSTGWIAAADVDLSSHQYRIGVALGAHRLTVHRGTELLLDTPVGVGTTDAPTPGGTYYVKELLQVPDPDGGYGPYAYGLSGFSNVFTSYAGGAGVIGIHGTDRPETVGTDVSDGCIRVTNDVVTRMVTEVGVPLGTPVVVAV